tara:strand:+ start:3364 stop:3564 length:201 start_codon:yes stop_codon:yes gene_type:complete
MKRKEIVVTKEQALGAYDNSNTKLAAALGIKNANISMWPDGEPIPRVHALYLVCVLKKAYFKGVLR